jgi:hypothetical protein
MSRFGQGWAAGLSGLVVVSTAGACVALWGVDELRYEAVSQGGGAGGTGGGGGFGGDAGGLTTSAAGGGTGGTGASCGEPQCDNCVTSQCAYLACEDQVQPCSQLPACTSLGTCATGCGANDASCATNCMIQSPNGVVPFMAVRDCVMCSPASCGLQCASSCTGCVSSGVDCNTCTNSTCASSACQTYVDACDNQCTSYVTCINDCAGNANCVGTCDQTYPAGRTSYWRLMLCLTCHPMTCAGVCATPPEECAGWAAL